MSPRPRPADANRLAEGERRSVCYAAPEVTKEGSRWVAMGYPGKKWQTLEQAIIYTVTQRLRS
jgi:hypothetical protein